MAVRDGLYGIGSSSGGRLLVKTARTGLGARAGHDLTIEATAWDGSVEVNVADPAQSTVSVNVEAGSLEVRQGTGGVKPLTASDRAEIERNIRSKILHTDRHPAITFQSAHVRGTPDSLSVQGELTIMGRANPVTVRAAVGDDGRVRGEVTVVQSAWGIKPYSAFFGALKLADEVVVEFEATLVTAAGGSSGE